MSHEERPPFDLDQALELIEKMMLIGITYYDKDGNTIARKQVHGFVKSVSAEKGIRLELKGINEGKEYNLPPDLRSVVKAKAGEYSLKDSKEIVVNPDFLATWDVRQS